MALVEPSEVVPADRLGRLHFIGIGGAGMSGIARIMLRRGLAVSGSDAKDSPALAELRDLGATVFAGHDAAHVRDADTVVISSAIRATNPELVVARERGLRVLHRSAALAALMVGTCSIAVTGTHGKTTTTSMLTVVLQHAGLDPSYCIGGQLITTGLGADSGSGDIFVAEADESDGSFLNFAPWGAVITNVEADHLDNYADFDHVRAAFEAFAGKVAPDGLLVVCADDPVAVGLGAAGDARVRTFGTDGEYQVRDFTARGLGSAFTLGTPDGEVAVELSVPGRHNAMNAAAAFAVAAELGVRREDIVAALASFSGARRRLELKGEAGGVRVFDSYAHHPTEVAADLRALRDYVTSAPGLKRVIVVFQPHLYSRTVFFAAEFGTALGLADEVVVLDVYAAREDPMPGVTGTLVADLVRPGGSVTYVPDFADAPGRVAALAAPGDVIITMGAGDVTTVGPAILRLLGGAGA
jgi:UDP-N-acetylmuramate--alanine ligase